MNRGSLRRNKANKKTKVLPQKENPKDKEKKTQELPTTGLRRSTRLNTVKEAASGFAEHIHIESSEGLEDSPRESLRLSPRVSPPPFSSRPRSQVQSPGIDPVQQ